LKQEQIENTKGRREFLKKFGLIAGSVAVGAAALGGVEELGLIRIPWSPTTGTVLSGDASVAYAYLGPSGEVTIQRDQNGEISQVSYGPATIEVTRNSDGSVASIQTSVSTDSISAVDTINRNLDGSVESVTRQLSENKRSTTSQSSSSTLIRNSI
jgi:hypothetical protein